MTSYFSSILTNTSSRYKSFRQSLFPDEADGDTEDDSHISRVLRAYCTEKGRPFPPWLPPDPKSGTARQARQSAEANSLPTQPRGGSSRRGLSDLWDSPQQQQQLQQPLSLRRGAPRATSNRGTLAGTAADEIYGPSQTTPHGAQQPQPTLGPDQRARSYQNTLPQRPPMEPALPSNSSGMGITAQEKLKARFWGSSRSGTAVSGSAASGSPQASPGLSQIGARNPYDRA